MGVAVICDKSLLINRILFQLKRKKNRRILLHNPIDFSINPIMMEGNNDK